MENQKTKHNKYERRCTLKDNGHARFWSNTIAFALNFSSIIRYGYTQSQIINKCIVLPKRYRTVPIIQHCGSNFNETEVDTAAHGSPCAVFFSLRCRFLMPRCSLRRLSGRSLRSRPYTCLASTRVKVSMVFCKRPTNITTAKLIA